MLWIEKGSSTNIKHTIIWEDGQEEKHFVGILEVQVIPWDSPYSMKSLLKGKNWKKPRQ